VNRQTLPPLREWQTVALSKWIASEKRGIVEVATAGGKTRFALECLTEYEKITQDPKTVILTPTTALSDQWFIALVEDHGVAESDICIWPEEKDSTKKYQIMVINTAREALPSLVEKFPNLFVIADECHRYASIENSKAFANPFKQSIGLTATARREFDDGLHEKLIPAFGEIIYEYTILNARQDEVVAPFELLNIEVPLSEDEHADYNKLSALIARAIKNGDEERAKILSMRRASVCKNSVNRVPTCLALVATMTSEKIVIFHESISKAEEIHSGLKLMGLSPGIYHSEISGPRRRENLRQFRKGITRIIVACRALDEGVDIPDANVAIVVASTSSLRQRVQRLGRVIRKHPEKDFASIYTFYSTPKEATGLIEEMNRLHSIAKTTWITAKNHG
jgi:superfamily II DNA or RNA helicase